MLHEDSRWHSRSRRWWFSSAVRSGIRPTRNTLQAMGDPASSRRPVRLWLLSSRRCICGCRIATRSDVRALVMLTNVVNSFRRKSDIRITIHLRTLSGGERHSAAQCSTLDYSRGGAMDPDTLSVSITTSRSAVLMGVERVKTLVILGWKSARILCVRRSFLSSTSKTRALF